MNFYLERQGPFANQGFEPGEDVKEFLSEAKILVIGAGGLGCELLKNLAMSGFNDLTVIDMDTIDLSNLNRQFLFRTGDIGKSKAVVAAKLVMERVKGVKVTSHYCKIQDFDSDFYAQFTLIICGLDSVEARRWMNATVVNLYDEDDPSTLKPLIDGGTEGFKGQARLILPKMTACFECAIEMQTKPKTYPLCTIANTPRLPEHCIEWASVLEWPVFFPGKKFDTDDPDHLRWVFEKAKTRADEYDILGVTYSLTQGVVKNIIPAIASTNAIIAAACANEAFKIVTNCVTYLNNYMMYTGDSSVYTYTFPLEKNPECPVCGTVSITLNCSPETTLKQLIQELIDKKQFQLIKPSLCTANKSLYMAAPRSLEEATRPNLDRPLKDLITDGTHVTITDGSLPISMNAVIKLVNNVRGPTSALSSFLREKGIRIDTGRNRDHEPAEQGTADNESSVVNETSLVADENAQDPHSLPVPIQVEQEPERMIASSSNSKGAKKKKRKMSFDDDLPVLANKKKANLNFCRRCCRRFLHDNQVECVACLGIKKTGQNSKKQKKVVNQDGEKVTFLSLRDLCLKTVAEYIEYVEEFGDISENSKQLISKIISRQRQINNSSLKLFLGPAETTLMVYDCTLITADGYEMISYQCPNLTTLTLGMCGRMRDLDIKKLVNGCPHLTNLELDGPFLCTDSGISELGQLSKLDSLSISNAAKITHESFSFLVNTSPLRLLKLRHCTSVGKGIGAIVNSFSKLQELRLEFIGDLSQDEIVMVIKNGGKLKTLCLEGFMNLTDTCLEQIAISCTSLSTLSVGGCEQLSNKGLGSFFEEFKPLLNYLSLTRVTSLEDDSLLKLISRQCGSLTDLDINGLDKLTNQSLKNLVSISNLKYVDLSWIRNVDNDLLDSLLRNCQLLSILKVYGCNRLTDDKLNLLHTNSTGQILQIHGNEFD